MDEREALAWLALSRVPGLGLRRLYRVVSRCGSAGAALESGEAWAGLSGGRPGRAEREWAKSQWQQVQRLGGRLLCVGEQGYPALLRPLSAPPPVLFVLGGADLDAPSIAIVGSRRAGEYGLQVAEELAGGLAAAGYCVVSGMAAGVDGAAHRGALEAGGQTVAVLGCGADVPYPAAHSGLHRRIREGGAVVSEFPLGAPPERASFPRRNRIISGLSLGVVVVEAPQKSGALITASFAAEQGRDVFAVPGDVRGGQSAGCHALLKDGARLVEGVEDVLQEVGEWARPAAAEAPALAGEEERVYGCLSRQPQHVDELALAAGMPPGALLDVLLRLELDGLVAQRPGGLFARRTPL